MKILVTDDDPRLREALEVGLQLQWEDSQVFGASDGEAGLEAFFREEPDIVLLDVAMPRMSGFEVLKEIRRVWWFRSTDPHWPSARCRTRFASPRLARAA